MIDELTEAELAAIKAILKQVKWGAKINDERAAGLTDAEFLTTLTGGERAAAIEASRHTGETDVEIKAGLTRTIVRMKASVERAKISTEFKFMHWYDYADGLDLALGEYGLAVDTLYLPFKLSTKIMAAFFLVKNDAASSSLFVREYDRNVRTASGWEWPRFESHYYRHLETAEKLAERLRIGGGFARYSKYGFVQLPLRLLS